MKLDIDSITWALNHLVTKSDTDLFPIPIEFNIISKLGEDAILQLADLNIEDISPGSPRRFIVPKTDIACRTATQLDPMDSIILASIIHQYGRIFEQKRISTKENKIYSYRFSPDEKGNLYDLNYSWNLFWNRCLEKSENYEYMVKLDISDFYNQIYHHSLENQLADYRGIPDQVWKWIMKLISKITANVSRGIPVGPHSANMLAEISFIPIDNSFVSQGIDFCRYVDDIIIFCNSEKEAKIDIYRIADILDKQQRLILQNQKTKIFGNSDFKKYCLEMIEDRPINDLEKNIINIINKYSKGNRYQTIYLSNISEEDLKEFNEPAINKILDDYLNQVNPDYTRLRWFIRRLSQVGHPSGVKFCLDNFEKLMPAISEICQYFVSVSNSSDINWLDIGSKLIKLLEDDLINSNDYFQISIYSLFNRKIELNHLTKIIKKYKKVSTLLQREIIIAAYKNNASDWIRELKEHFYTMDVWSRRAFLISCSILPKKEKYYYIDKVTPESLLENLIIQWVKNNNK
jgi:hypothetical protein